MYKHRVHYTYDKPQGMISETQTLEFELEKDLEKDGPGQWRNICANIIQSKTGISAHLVRTKNDSSFRCISLGKVVTGNEPKNVSYSEFKREQKIIERQERADEERRERRESIYREQEENQRQEEYYEERDRLDREERARFAEKINDICKMPWEREGYVFVEAERTQFTDEEMEEFRIKWEAEEAAEAAALAEANRPKTLSDEFKKVKDEFSKSIEEVKKSFKDSIENIKSEFQTTKDKFKDSIDNIKSEFKKLFK